MMNLRYFMILLVAGSMMIACKSSDQARKKDQAKRTVYTRDGHSYAQPKMIGGNRALTRALKYPSNAQQSRMEGTVVLNFKVTQKGKVKDVKVKHAPSPSLANAAVHAIKKMHFKPALKDGKPVKVRYSWPVYFRLN